MDEEFTQLVNDPSIPGSLSVILRPEQPAKLPNKTFRRQPKQTAVLKSAEAKEAQPPLQMQEVCQTVGRDCG